MFSLIKSMTMSRVPFLKHVGVRIDDIGNGHATTHLPDEAHLKNHVGSAHAAAIFMACKTASGVATAGAFGSVFLDSRPVVREARITYLRPATGAISAQAKVQGDASLLLQRLHDAKTVDFEVVVDAVNPDGVKAATATYIWNLKLSAQA
jgi:acyl-coenzyme A thioesterase PaaI-like protein